MTTVFYSILPIFLVLLMGFVIRHKWIVAEEFWRGIEKLSYFLLFPALLFNLILDTDFTSIKMGRLVFALLTANILVTFGLIFYRIRYEIDKIIFTSVYQGSIRYNSYIFLALCSSLYLEEGLKIAAVVASYMIIATNTATIIVFHLYAPPSNNEINSSKYKQFATSLFSNPLILTSIVAITFNYCGIDTNIGIKKFLKILGDASLPLGIMNVGSALKFNIQNLNIRSIIVSSISKLVLLPLVTLIVLWVFDVKGLLKSIAILHSALPTATSSYILSRRLGGDPDSMASIVTSTTVLSMISLTLVMYMIR